MLRVTVPCSKAREFGGFPLFAICRWFPVLNWTPYKRTHSMKPIDGNIGNRSISPVTNNNSILLLLINLNSISYVNTVVCILTIRNAVYYDYYTIRVK